MARAVLISLATVLAVIPILFSAVQGQSQEVLYFTTWNGNGEKLMSHMNAIKEHAELHKKRLVVDAETMEYLRKSGSLENSKVTTELDVDVFAKAKAEVIKNADPRSTEKVERFYDNLGMAYEDLKSNKLHSSASDVMRTVAFTAYSDQEDHLVYHDADIRFKPLSQDHLANLKSQKGDMKIVMVANTKRKDPALGDKLSFVEPKYFYELTSYEYPKYTQFNSDLIFMRKKAARNSAVTICMVQLQTFLQAQTAMVERIHGEERIGMTVHDAIRASHPEGARFVMSEQTALLLHRRKFPLYSRYTPVQLKHAYVNAIGLNPLDVLLGNKLDVIWRAAGSSQSSHVIIDGEEYLRRDMNVVLRTLEMKGDLEVRKAFLSEFALDPADVGAVSRQDAQNWYGDASNHDQDVPVYTMKEEAAILALDDHNSAYFEHSRPSSPELSEVENLIGANLRVSSDLSSDIVPEVEIIAPEEVLPAPEHAEAAAPDTDHEPFNSDIVGCQSLGRRARREASRCSLYEEENFSITRNGEFLYKDKFPVQFTREEGSLRMEVESPINHRNIITRVTTEIPGNLIEALVQKRKTVVETARAQLEAIVGDPEVELAMKAMIKDAQSVIPHDEGRMTKRMGSAYARMATGGTKSQLAVKTWVVGARAYGVFTNIGALMHGDPLVKTFAALDLSQTVNDFMAHKLAQYAKTKALSNTLRLLADNPIMNMAGTAASVFFFAQNVRNVAEGHHSPSDYYWLTRSSMQMLTLVFEGLNPAMLPMLSVDVLVSIITQGEYAAHVVRSVANKLPLSTADMWKLGASSFFGSTSLSSYYNSVAELERVNNRLANSLLKALDTVNIVVGFPLTTVINEWRNPRGRDCVESMFEVWPAILSRNEHNLSRADFSMERSVPLKEVYIGDADTQQLCYELARKDCFEPNRSGFHKFMESLSRSVGTLPTNEECVFYDQTVPNATDPCGNMYKFVEDAVERKRLVPLTTPESGDPLMEPQLRALTVNKNRIKMISRPLGWMKESNKCSPMLYTSLKRQPFLTARCLCQCFIHWHCPRK